MEFEIGDDPQGETDKQLGDRYGGVVEDHSALENQSTLVPDHYSFEKRRAQSLVSNQTEG